MASKDTLFCGFIDLVGIREMARNSPHEYWEKLGLFQEHLAEYAHLIHGDGGQIFSFSDCAFLQVDTADRILLFFRALRHRLLQDGMFFKAAIMQGSLSARPVHEALSIKNPKLQEIISSTVFGYVFGDIAGDLFSLHERLKGIGVFVKTEKMLASAKKEHLVTSCYLPHAINRSAEIFNDIRLGAEDLQEGILDIVLRAFFAGKTQALKIGRFYISLLVTWIKSMNLDGLEYSRSSEGNLVSLLLSGRFQRMFGDVGGFELVYFALLERVYREREKISLLLFYDTRRYIVAQRSIVKWMNAAPREILSSEVRRTVLEDISGDLVAMPREERRTIEAVRQKVEEGKSFADIAEELEGESYPKPRRGSGRWHANTVRSICARENIAVPED